MRLAALVAGLSLAACGGGGGGGAISDGGRTDGANEDASVGTDAERTDDGGPPDAFVPTCAPLTGTGPLEIRMAGQALLSKRFTSTPGEQRLLTSRIDLFFPQGRTPGAVVHASRYIGPRGSLSGQVQTSGVIAADGSFGPLRLAALQAVYGFSIDGALLPAPHGILANVGVETGFNDVSEFFTGTMELCPSGLPDPPELAIAAQHWSPLAQFRIVSATPLEPSSLATIRASAGGADVPLVVFSSYDHIRLSPVAAFPPDAQPMLDVTGVRDVLGRAPTATVNLEAPPSAEVVDLTFAAPLPAGSAVSRNGQFGQQALTVANGVLVAALDFWSGATIALGDRTGSTAVIRHKIDCGGFGSPQYRVAIVAADGSFSELPSTCSSDFADTRIVVPGSGKRWLAISVPAWWFGAPTPRVGTLTIDEIRFE